MYSLCTKCSELSTSNPFPDELKGQNSSTSGIMGSTHCELSNIPCSPAWYTLWPHRHLPYLSIFTKSKTKSMCYCGIIHFAQMDVKERRDPKHLYPICSQNYFFCIKRSGFYSCLGPLHFLVLVQKVFKRTGIDGKPQNR